MTTTCSSCHLVYDDARNLTICPHPQIADDATLARKDLACRLMGKRVAAPECRWCAAGKTPDDHDCPDALVSTIESIGFDGMVTLRGIPGEFDPKTLTVQP